MELLLVFGLGVVELWAAIPTGLALGLHPAVTGVTAAVGAIIGALIIGTVGKGLRAWLLRWHPGARVGGQPRGIHRLWSRYGVIGLGLVGPMLLGAPAGTALGITLGAPRGRLLLWMGIGILLWSAGLTLAGALVLSSANIDTIG